MCARSQLFTQVTHTNIYLLWSFIVFSLWLVRLPPQLSERSLIDIPKNYVHQWTEHDKPSRRRSQKKKSKVIWIRIKLQIWTSTKTRKKTNLYTHSSYIWTKTKIRRYWVWVHLFLIKIGCFLRGKVRNSTVVHMHIW